MPGQAPDLSGLPANSPSPQAQLSAQSQQPTVNPPDHTPKLKQLLSSFFVGAGSAMMHQVGLETPQEKQAREFRQGIQQQQLSSLDKERQALEGMQQSMALKNQQEAMGVEVTPAVAQMTGMPIGSRIPKPLMDFITKSNVANIAGNSRENVADTNVQGRINVANINNQGKADQFRQTLAYKTWKEKLDNDTRLKVGQMNAGKAPAAMMQTATFANGGLDLLNDARSSFQDLKNQGVLGSVAQDKLENAIFGNGYVDPSLSPDVRQKIGKLRAAMSYTSSAAMRAHTGRTSTEIYNDFKNTLGLNQGSDALEGAMDETQKMLSGYSKSASDAAILNLRNMSNSQPAKSTHRYNPATQRIEPIGK